MLWTSVEGRGVDWVKDGHEDVTLIVNSVNHFCHWLTQGISFRGSKPLAGGKGHGTLSCTVTGLARTDITQMSGLEQCLRVE